MRLYMITGTCGAGKSTIKDQLAAMLDPGRYACVDSDETGLNWWDYAGTDRESQYGADSLKEAFRMAGGRDLVFVTCMVPQDYMTKTTVPGELQATYYIALWAPDEVIEQRLRARPKERGFTSDEAIRPHIEYNQWIGRNRGKYQLFINNEAQSEEETAKIIAEYIKALPAVGFFNPLLHGSFFFVLINVRQKLKKVQPPFRRLTGGYEAGVCVASLRGFIPELIDDDFRFVWHVIHMIHHFVDCLGLIHPVLSAIPDEIDHILDRIKMKPCQTLKGRVHFGVHFILLLQFFGLAGDFVSLHLLIRFSGKGWQP